VYYSDLSPKSTHLTLKLNLNELRPNLINRNLNMTKKHIWLFCISQVNIRSSRQVILELKDVTKTFGKLAAVSSLSFSVDEGEIFGIAGPNGAGKTTLFNVISGFYSASGTILFDGQRIDRLRPDQINIRGVARTFQIPLLFDSMTIYESLLVGAYFGGRNFRNKEKRINELLTFFGLKDRGGDEVANLKLLDKKLAMAASAMATDPKLLLLDEPVAGLNPAEAEHFVALVKRLNKKHGLTIIIIEHLMNILTEMSDRLMILNNGVKICLGPPEEVVTDPQVIECYLGKGNARG